MAAKVLLVTMFAVWVLVQEAGFDDQLLAASVCNLGLVPGGLTRLAPLGSGVPIGPGLACVIDDQSINLLTPLLSMFLFVIILKVIPIPAWLVLIYWFALQLLSGLPDLLSPNPQIAGGVAVWAHVGGFAAGVLLI